MNDEVLSRLDHLLNGRNEFYKEHKEVEELLSDLFDSNIPYCKQLCVYYIAHKIAALDLYVYRKVSDHHPDILQSFPCFTGAIKLFSNLEKYLNERNKNNKECKKDIIASMKDMERIAGRIESNLNEMVDQFNEPGICSKRGGEHEDEQEDMKDHLEVIEFLFIEMASRVRKIRKETI